MNVPVVSTLPRYDVDAYQPSQILTACQVAYAMQRPLLLCEPPAEDEDD